MNTVLIVITLVILFIFIVVRIIDYALEIIDKAEEKELKEIEQEELKEKIPCNCSKHKLLQHCEVCRVGIYK
jgi:Tfp pilus assembly protein PilO